MKLIHSAILLCLGLFLVVPAAPASTILLGSLSYDTFIPASGDGSPGVNAFDIANLTGAFSLPEDFPVADDLTFQSAMLTLTLADMSQQTFDLGDIAPGFLLDGDGNPLVQVSSDGNFISAEFTANLSSLSFTLFDGTPVTAGSSVLHALLTPSNGQTLVADADFSPISTSNTAATTPEPGSILLLTGGLVVLLRRRR
jgi:hypothetical protein